MTDKLNDFKSGWQSNELGNAFSTSITRGIGNTGLRITEFTIPGNIILRHLVTMIDDLLSEIPEGDVSSYLKNAQGELSSASEALEGGRSTKTELEPG